MAMLPRSGRTAPRLSLILLHPKGCRLSLTQPPPASLLEVKKMSTLLDCCREVTSSPSYSVHSAHSEQEMLHDDLKQAVAGPLTPSQGSTCSAGRPMQAPKRRAGNT